MSSPILTTNRLIIRQFSLDDAQSMFDLNNDPEVIRYTGDPPFSSLQAAQNFLENYKDYEQNGYGRWAVLLQENQEFLGWCGLKYSPDKDETDIGFRFFRKHWNKGYATESATAALNYGFKQLGFKKIVGRAMKANTASIRVLEKLGMHYEKDIEMDGQTAVQFLITSEK